jgi:hypothetical protein
MLDLFRCLSRSRRLGKRPKWPLPPSPSTMTASSSGLVCPRRRATTPREVSRTLERAIERNLWLGWSTLPFPTGEVGCVLHQPTYRMYEGFDETLIES